MHIVEHIYCLCIVRQISICQDMTEYFGHTHSTARLAQSVEHETLNLRVVGSSPTLGDIFLQTGFCGTGSKNATAATRDRTGDL